MKKVQIPEKTYFKIGEVARLLDVEPYVLRYWETEFDSLKPEKTKTGQRSYRRTDIELLLTIQHLLYDEEYTISGARRQLKLMKKNNQTELPDQTIQRLEDRVKDLQDEIAPLKQDLEPLHTKIRALEKENSAVKAAYRELEKRTDALRQEVADNELAGAVAEERDQLEQSLVESRRLVGRQATEMTKLKSEIEVLTKNNQELRSDNDQLNVSKVDASELELLEKRLSDAMTNVAALQNEKDQLERSSERHSQVALRRMVNLRKELEGLARLTN